MAIRHTPYAGITNPQMSFLDDSIADLGAQGIVPCTASGTNVITLSPLANTTLISAYANLIQFSFVAVNSSTGNVTLQVGSLAALNVYFADGVTQVGNGSIVAARQYVVMFNSALNSSVGGWVIIGGPNYPVGQIPGTATNDSANTGNVGEYLSSIVVQGSAIALTNVSAANITSISLTSGDWDVWASPYFTGNAATVLNAVVASINNVSNTLNQVPPFSTSFPFNSFTGFANANPMAIAPLGPVRFSVTASSSQVFLVVQSSFTTNTASGFGAMQARRAR
jgi:hypothetical protein